MVQTPNDSYKLKQNEQQFINKPLKNLLNEIKPEIKMADGTLNSPDYFTFRFVSHDEYLKDNNKKYIRIYVFVKEPINWDRANSPEDKKFIWTKKDVNKYANYTIIRIRVSGND